MASQLSIGTSAYATLTVGSSDLANAVALEPDDNFPAVFATPRLIALMEIASARILKPLLGPGQLSVGVTIDASHTAATLPGCQVVAEATYVRSEGKLFVFEVVARDEGGEIGKALHKRAIVSVERLEEGARKRAVLANTKA